MWERSEYGLPVWTTQPGSTYSTCFTRFYPCYTCLIPLSSHSQPLLLLYLSAWHFALVPHCLAFRLRMSGIALDLSRFEWISCRIFLLRSVFGKKKRQVKQDRCPDQASVNPKQASGKGADEREKFHLNIYGYEQEI